MSIICLSHKILNLNDLDSLDMKLLALGVLESSHFYLETFYLYSNEKRCTFQIGMLHEYFYWTIEWIFCIYYSHLTSVDIVRNLVCTNTTLLPVFLCNRRLIVSVNPWRTRFPTMSNFWVAILTNIQSKMS